jgi:hypothetical protein
MTTHAHKPADSADTAAQSLVEHHRQAASHLVLAAKQHEAAAHHAQRGDHEAASHHAHLAHGHRLHAQHHEDLAAKSHASDHA